jgi:hypothetical protein
MDRNMSPENPDLGKLISIGESHGLRFPLRSAANRAL